MHLSLLPPPARSGERDWLAAQRRVLDQVEFIRRKINRDIPILCAGDIFDKWNSPPEVINFALDALPNNIIAIPGQHDLPLHSLDELHKSAYWTLVASNKINTQASFLKLNLTMFPYGVDFAPFGVGDSGKGNKIAMLHRYTWIDGTGYAGAPASARLGSILKSVVTYDTVIIGDNHNPFSIRVGNTNVFNCGCLIRRKADEIYYRPRVGVILRNGGGFSIELPTDKDIIAPTKDDSPQNNINDNLNISGFLKDLASLSAIALDFVETAKQIINKVNPPEDVKRLLLTAIENGKRK